MTDFNTKNKSLCSLKLSISEYIKKWGNATSIALLDPMSHIFSSTVTEGVIGYREISNCLVAFGDPVCSAENKLCLANAFHEYCEKQGKNIVYIASSEEFMNIITNYRKYAAIEVGKEIILDPSADLISQKGKDASSLRNKYNQFNRSDINIHEYLDYDETLEKQMQETAIEWSNSRIGPQIHFFSHIDLFKEREHKRLFYAKKRNKIIAILMLNRIDSKNGWVLNMLMLLPKAPKYLSESIILYVLNILKEERCPFLSIGLTPSLELGSIIGLNKIYAWFARLGFKISKKIFKLQDKQRYWKKFSPNSKSSYLIFSSPYLTPKTIIALMRALNANI